MMESDKVLQMNNHLTLFLPCAAGVEDLLANEVAAIAADHAATAKLQLAEQYNTFAGKAASMGLIDKKDADIDSYVTQKAMDGLFLMIAEEEKKLRSNPMQAGSALLKKVFGAL